MHRLQDHLHKKNRPRAGIYSVCSSHPYVLRAAAEQAVADSSMLLVEATSNQVNQFGGYTGMRPAGFRKSVEAIAQKAGLLQQKLILGGDHLGPNPWRTRRAEDALRLGEAMIAEYVDAGFTKIHLDTSMSCAGEASALPDDEVAARAVRLCRAAEAACVGSERPVYVIGTEVPSPGGATHSLQNLKVTLAARAAQTLEIHRRAFHAAGLEDAWSRVIAMVVQPGVEFDHDSVVNYVPAKAAGLTMWLDQQPGSMVFEAHSTDYQRRVAYRELVQDGFQILKVGPALTFAMREALYALEEMEQWLIPASARSHLREVMEESMRTQPCHWESHYNGSENELAWLRVFSFSDRIRYYWNSPEAIGSVERLLGNLKGPMPLSILSQYLPLQYQRVRDGQIENDPMAVVIDRVQDTLRDYASGCSN